MTSRRGLIVVLIAVLSVIGADRAFAHAFLDHADPAVGSTVAVSPKDVRLWFTEELEPAFSTLRVVDGAGKSVDSKDGCVDSSNPTVMKVSLPILPPGTYRVIWRAVSVDSHATEGDFTFDVKAAP